MALTPVQKEVSDNPSRFKVIVAGRRWGKTHLSMNEIAKFARYPNKKVFYVAPTYRQAKQILWDDLKAKLLACNWARKINESDLTIVLVNGSKIHLRSADNPDSLRGISIDFLVMDEAAMIDFKTWTEVLRPALSDRQGHAMFITTPKGRNWIYDLWTGAHTQENWTAFSYTTLDGGNVPPEEIEAAKSELDEKSFRQEYEATFETYAGMIYYNWNPGANVDRRPVDDIPRNEILHVAMDFNVTPLVAGIARITGNEIHFIDEIVMDGSNTYEMADELNSRYPNNRMWVYPDASGQARKTSSNTSDHNILRQAGMTIKAKGINPPVKDRIAAMNASLKSANGEVKLTIDPKCKQIIKCISNQTYKEGTQVPDKTSGLDHMNDAVGYLVHWINPIKRPSQEHKGPELFGHY
jgi:uncharacterized FlaG/YvyC family protein